MRRPLRSAVAVTLRVASVVAIVGGAALAQPDAEDAGAALALVPGAGEFVRDGAVLYDYHCAACHGDTGRGLSEARTAFPESHRACERCHRPSNPARMPPAAMAPNDAFDVGRAPPLLGPEADLAAFGTGAGLFEYVRATMPRFAPGSLEEDTYLRIAAFLGAAAGAEVPSGPLDRAGAEAIDLP